MNQQEAGSDWPRPEGFPPAPMGSPIGGPPMGSPVGGQGGGGGSGGFRQSFARTIGEAALVLLLLALVLFGVRGCAGCTASAIVSQLPPSVDASIGKAAGEATRAQHSAGLGSKEPTEEQKARVERVFNELREGLTPEETRVLVSPRVTTIVDEQVNAFALPGGEVFVLTGLLDRVQSDDDMLRGVLAHELGHAVHRHGVRALVRNGVYGIALSFFLGDMNGVAATIVGGASKLDTLQYSRSMEEEADEFGVDLLLRIHSDPEGLARFMESLESAPVPGFLSTHPDSKERAKAIRERMKEKRKE